MKTIVLLIFFAITLQNYGQDTSSITEFGITLFNAVKENNIQDFRNLQITKEGMKEGFETYIKDTDKKEHWLKIIDEYWEEIYAGFVLTSLCSFDSLFLSGKRMNIKWDETNFIRFDYEFSEKDPDLKYVYGDIFFEYRNKEYSFYVKDAIFLKDTWYIELLEDKRIILIE